MPSITGAVEFNLSVRDPERSAGWYAELLGMQTRYDHTSNDGRIRYICLVEPTSSLTLCLASHAENTGEPFSEFRTGLDHLEVRLGDSERQERGRRVHPPRLPARRP